MSGASDPSIYESKFAKSEKTDAVLVIDGKKLHVNKALLSIHSEYFNSLFNSDFEEKTKEQIEIKDVNFEDFVVVLSLIHPNPVTPTDENVEKLLGLAQRFLLPCATHTLGLYLLSAGIGNAKKLQMADKFNLEDVVNRTLRAFTTVEEMKVLPQFATLSDKTKVKFFNRQLELSYTAYHQGGYRRY